MEPEVVQDELLDLEEGQDMAQPGLETEGQPETPELSDDETAAALGFITTLSEQQMPQMTPQTPETAPEQEKTEEPTEDLSSAKDEIIGEVRSLKEEMVSEDMKQEFEEIKGKLDELLKEDDNQDANEETES